MSSKLVSKTRRALLERLTTEVRSSQRATDVIDELVCELLGINRSDARCLDILEQHDSLTAGQLAEQSGLTTGAITAVLDRLQRAGYVRRRPDPADRRRVVVELEPKARQASWELYGPLAEAVGPLASRYSDEELALFIDFQRTGREMQERHAEWLRETLRQRREGL